MPYRRTTVEIDIDELSKAEVVLGTSGIKETVNGALKKSIDAPLLSKQPGMCWMARCTCLTRRHGLPGERRGVRRGRSPCRSISWTIRAIDQARSALRNLHVPDPELANQPPDEVGASAGVDAHGVGEAPVCESVTPRNALALDDPRLLAVRVAPAGEELERPLRPGREEELRPCMLARPARRRRPEPRRSRKPSAVSRPEKLADHADRSASVIALTPM